MNLLLLIVLSSSISMAEDSATDESPAQESQESQESVRTGWGWAALPTPNYTSDNGVGYGLYGALYNYGPEGSGDEPYKAKIAAQFYQTTKLYMDHFINLDFPDIAGTQMRWDLKTGFEAWNHATYFGRGNYLPRYHSDAALFAKEYYEFALKSAKLFTNLRIPIGGNWETLVNYRLRYALYSDKDETFNEGNLISIDQPTGYEGGAYSQLSLGIIFDNRNQEPSPTSGMYSEFSIRGASWLIGSKWDSVGFNLTDRRWYALTSGERLVFANRFIADYTIGDVPFFEDFVLGGSQFVQLGGSLSMRGLVNGRYRGDLIMIMDPELRWTVLAATIGSSTLDIMAVPFADIGRVWAFEQDEPDALTHLHYTGGLGWRFAWNDNFLVRLDVAWGVEEYVPLDMDAETLDPTDVEREANMGFYLVFDHPY